MTQEIIEKLFEVGNAPKLIVKNIRGSIRISPCEMNNINIKAIKHLEFGDFENTEINIEKTSDDVVLVEAKYDHKNLLNLSQPGKVEFIIETPINTSLRVNTISSTVEILGLDSDIKLNSVSGKITLSDISGKLFAKTISGALIGNQIEGNIHAKTVSGKVDIRKSNLSSIESKTVSGSTFLESLVFGEGPYTFNSVSGKTTFIIPQNTNCSVQAATVSGSFKTDLETTGGTINKNKWNIDLEGGGPQIFLKNVSGSLRLLTSENAKAYSPRKTPLKNSDQMAVLQKLEDGEISVKETLSNLS